MADGTMQQAIAAAPLETAAPASPSLEAQGALAEAQGRIGDLMNELMKLIPVIGQYGDAQQKSAILKAVAQLNTSFSSSAPKPPSDQMAAAIQRGMQTPSMQPPATSAPQMPGGQGVPGGGGMLMGAS